MFEAIQRAFHSTKTRVTLRAKPLPEPEPFLAKPRQMTGFFAGLTPEQQKAALAHRGAENYGEADGPRAKPGC